MSPLRMTVIRSFDVNKLGFDADKMTGVVAGGSIIRVCYVFYCWMIFSKIM